jgi:hypothetical protein
MLLAPAAKVLRLKKENGNGKEGTRRKRYRKEVAA